VEHLVGVPLGAFARRDFARRRGGGLREGSLAREARSGGDEQGADGPADGGIAQSFPWARHDAAAGQKHQHVPSTFLFPRATRQASRRIRVSHAIDS